MSKKNNPKNKVETRKNKKAAKKTKSINVFKNPISEKALRDQKVTEDILKNKKVQKIQPIYEIQNEREGSVSNFGGITSSDLSEKKNNSAKNKKPKQKTNGKQHK